jgi:hypothetical protein
MKSAFIFLLSLACFGVLPFIGNASAVTVVVGRGVAAGGGGKPAGYYLWFKPESLAGSDTDPISTWADSGSAAKDATASLTARPLTQTNEFDGLAVAHFDGANDFMATASVAHGIGTGDFTWTAWVKHLSDTGTSLGVCGNGVGAPGLYTELSATTAWGGYWAADRSSGNTLTAGANWYHLTFMRSGTTLKFYQNGTQTGTTHTLATSMSDAAFTLGDGGFSSFGGEKYIAEITCWARALSDQEVADDFALRTP